LVEFGGLARVLTQTAKRSPYHDAIKIEALWRDLPAGGVEMTVMVDDFRPLFNPVRPYETLAGARPIERYLADPDDTPPDDVNAIAPTRQKGAEILVAFCASHLFC